MGKARSEAWMQLPVLKDGRWTGEWHHAQAPIATPTLASLRDPSRYWIVSDAQLARDLKPRTLRTIYAENRRGRDALAGSYVARWETGYSNGGGLFGGADIKAEYLAWCKARNHTPHPASIDPDHPINKWRERCPPRELVEDDTEYLMAAD